MILVIVGIAAALGDLTSSLGIPAVLPQSVVWNTTPDRVNHTNALNVLML